MPLCSYVLQSDFGANKAGDVVQMDMDEAQSYLEAGLLAEATPEDVSPNEEPTEDAPDMESQDEEMAVTRAINDGFTKLADALGNQTKSKPVELGNFAMPKTAAIKGLADLCRTQYRAKNGDRNAYNKLTAYQQEISRKAPAGMNEGTSSQGGYSVIPEWTDEIFSKVKAYPRLLDMTNKVTISGSTLNIPAINETSLADGSRGGGILNYWVSEGNTVTTSYPAMTQVQAVLNTDVVMIPLTNQLLEDNSYNLDAFLAEKVAEEFTWSEDYGVLRGSGTGQPKGILNQASLVTITKESGQAAASVVFPNLAKMWAALWPPSRANACWLANPLVYQQLIQMTFPNASGTYPAFGFVSWNAHEEFPLRIFGKPVHECLMTTALGIAGDIILCDLKQLTTAEHPGMQVAVSDQVYFTSLQTLFRFVRRFDIQSPWTAGVTDFNSQATYSPFVVLQSRGS